MAVWSGVVVPSIHETMRACSCPSGVQVGGHSFNGGEKGLEPILTWNIAAPSTCPA